jgi:hypothetical protein
MTWLLSSAVVITRTWKNGKIVLIAYHLLESSLGAYIEWSVNELMMTANKMKYKDAHLVMLLADAISPQARKPCIILGVISFLLTGKSYGV